MTVLFRRRLKQHLLGTLLDRSIISRIYHYHSKVHGLGMKSPRIMMKLIQAMGVMVRAKNKSKDTSVAPCTERDWSTRATLAESAMNR